MKLVDKNGKEININPTIMTINDEEMVVVGVDENEVSYGEKGYLYFMDLKETGNKYSFKKLGIVKS